MPIQWSLRFDEVPITCSVQERYHAVAPCWDCLKDGV